MSYFFFNSLLSIFAYYGEVGNIKTFVNLSDSMVPAIKPGDIVVIEKGNGYSYKKGDIVTFYSNFTGQIDTVTHRIHDIAGNIYITKGDNNLYPDAQYLKPRLVIGKVIMTIPIIGFWIIVIKNIYGSFFFIVLPMILIIFNETLKILCSRNSEIKFRD